MRRTFGITIAAIAAGLSVACSTGPTGTWRDELARAQDRWASHGVTQYVIRIQRSCFCGGPLDVEVRVNGANVSRIDRATGDPIAPQFALAFPTVLGLFQVIAEQIDLPAASLTVSYDPTYGYPLSIVADPIGKAGLAHFAEHLMFQMRPDGPTTPPIFQTLLELATFVNAFTAADMTHYWTTVRSENFELMGGPICSRARPSVRSST